MTAKGKVASINIAGAERKLRQAEFFLGWLEHAPREIARERFSGIPERTEHLEFLFSACLSAAQSVYEVLMKTGGPKFYQLQKDWQKGLKNDGRSQFKWMKRLRGEDVHFASTPAKPLQKYIEDDHWSREFAYQQPLFRSAALSGPAPVIEEINPDGRKVSGSSLRGSSLRGTVGLYIKFDGRIIEATTVCRAFIEQLRSLLDVTKAAFPP